MPGYDVVEGVGQEPINAVYYKDDGDQYRPHCDGCRACVPARVRVADFQPRRRHKRLRRRNAEQFGGSNAEGIGAGFWWAAVSMTTVGYGDKAPVTLAGRLLALVWMFAGLIMVASFTAAITSSLTVSNLQYQINGPQDLPGNTVATIAGTASAQYLQEQRIISQEYPDLHSAMQAVSTGESDAVVYDRPLLQYRNQQLGKDRLDLLPGVFDQQLYALALPTGSNLRDEVNEAILRLTESPEWRLIQRAYLGEAP